MMNKLIVMIACLIITSTTSYGNYQPGDIVKSSNDEYTITQSLGGGYFGEVFAAKNSNQWEVALKTYIRPDEENNDFLNAFNDAEREYAIGQQLKHPHIIESIEYFVDQKVANEIRNLVLEYVSGKTLSNTTNGELPLAVVKQATLDLCAAVKHAQENEFINIDLSTNNVMISCEGKLKLIDLGSFFSIEDLQMYCGVFIEEFYADANSEFQVRKINKAMIPAKVLAFIEKSLLKQMLGTSQKLCVRGFYHLDMNIIYAAYINAINERIFEAIDKSNISRAEKIKVRQHLIAIAWNCHEDLIEGIFVSFEHYLAQIEQVLTVDLKDTGNKEVTGI